MTAFALKSPVNRMGGKSLLVGWLCGYLPQHTAYIEPFCGAGHLLFSKSPSPVEIVNDIDQQLINFFRVIRPSGKRQALVERLQYMPYSRSLWQEIRTQWNQGALPQDEIERAAAWFYLNRSCFSGDMLSGGFAVPSTTGRNTAQSYRNAIDSLEHIAERLRNVCIENLPYDEVIRRYDSEGSLFYVDPPYLDSEHYYGKGNFALDDHRTLSELLHGIKGKAMVFHYANGLYDDLYRGWNRYEYQSFKGAHKSTGEAKPVTTEILYTNFKTQRGLFDEMG